MAGEQSRGGRLVRALWVSVGVHLLVGALLLVREPAPPVPAPARPRPVEVSLAWREAPGPGAGPGRVPLPALSAPPPRAQRALAPPLPVSELPRTLPRQPPRAPASEPPAAGEAPAPVPPEEERPVPGSSEEQADSTLAPREGPAAAERAERASPGPVGVDAALAAAGAGSGLAEAGAAPAAAGAGSALSGPGGGGGPGAELEAYREQLSRQVARQRRYPAQATRLGLEGLARVRVRLQRSGTLAAPPRLEGSSGYAVLDAEALRMVQAAAPYEPLPASLEGNEREFLIPVQFSLRQGAPAR